MRKTILIFLVLMFAVVPFAHAQETSLELPVIADGDVISAQFEDNITAHLYAFYGSAGDTVTVIMEQQSDDLDSFLVLFDSEGAILGYDDDSGTTPFSALLDNIELSNDGVYFVMATSPLFVDAIETAADDELPYLLSVTGQTTPDDVDDESVLELELEILTVGEAVDAEISIDLPMMIFALELTDGDDVLIGMESDDFFTLLHVITPEGNRSGADPSLVDISAESDGIYIIIATEQFFYESMDDNSIFEGGTFTLITE